MSVRTLRHYHQVGVLAEPHRRRNGYREYDVADLIRVLRIRRMAALGIPLDRMPSLLENDTEAGELLDALDAELVAQIAGLTTRREHISRLRASNAAPDVPPELAPFLAAFAAQQAPGLSPFDRDQSVLVAHLAGEQGMPHVAHFYELLSAPDTVRAVVALAAEFDQLGPETSEVTIAALADRFIATFGPVFAELTASSLTDLSAVADVFEDHAVASLNEQQRRVIDALKHRLADATQASR